MLKMIVGIGNHDIYYIWKWNILSPKWPIDRMFIPYGDTIYKIINRKIM